METLRVKLIQGWMRLSRDRDIWEVLKGSGITFFLRVCSFLLIYLINFTIAKVYGPFDLGIYSLSLTILNIGLVLVTLGTDTAIVRWISEYRAQNEIGLAKEVFAKVIKFTLITSIVCSLCFYFFADQFVTILFDEKRLVDPVKIVACLLPFALMSRLFASGFRGLKQVRQSITYDVLGTRVGSFLILLILVFFFPSNHLYPMYALAIATLINTLLAAKDWNINLRRWKEQSKECTSRTLTQTTALKNILSVSLPMYLTSSMILVMDWTDTIMLGILAGTEVVGEYSVVLKLSLITSFALASINTIILPKFSEMYWSGNSDGLQSVIRFSNRLSFWTSVPLIVVIALYSEPLLALFGSQFEVGTSSLVILCIGQCVNSATGSVISLLTMTGHQKKSRNILMMSALLNMIGNLVLIPLLGMMGAAIATSCSMIVRDVVATHCANRIFGFRTWYVPFFSALIQQRNRVGGTQNEE